MKYLLLLLTLLSSAQAATTVLSVYAEGRVGNDKVWTLSEANGYSVGFFENRLGDNPKWRLTFYAHTADHLGDWQLDFSARSFDGRAVDLMVGQYLGTTAFGSVTTPALRLTGNGYGGSDPVGQFEILELVWNPDLTPAKVAMDFRFVGATTGYDYMGSLRYNPNVPVTPVPEPSMIAFAAVGLVALSRRRR